MPVYCSIWTFCMNFFFHLQMCVLTENSLNLQQTGCAWPMRPLVVVHYLSFSLLFTRYLPFNFLNIYCMLQPSRKRKCKSFCFSSAGDKIQRQRQQNHDRTWRAFQMCGQIFKHQSLGIIQTLCIHRYE